MWKQKNTLEKVNTRTISRQRSMVWLAIDPDYVALGPIYPTKLKQMAFGPQGTERLGEWKKLVGAKPLVAIGGLTLERALLCLASGADVASVVGDIVNHADPIGQAKAWIAATRRTP